MEAYGITVRELVAWVSARGFECYRYATAGGEKRLVVGRPETDGPGNYLFVHPRRAAPLLAMRDRTGS